MKKSRKKKDPLGFVCWHDEVIVLPEGFTGFEQQIRDLGYCNPDWFQEASAKASSEDKVKKQDQVTPVKNLEKLSDWNEEYPSIGAGDLQSPLSLLLASSTKKHGNVQVISTPKTPTATGLDVSLLKSLGVDPNHTDKSWTSSLATTPKHGRSAGQTVCFSTEADSITEDKIKQLPMTAARALFSPGCQHDLDKSEIIEIEPLHYSITNITGITAEHEDPSAFDVKCDKDDVKCKSQLYSSNFQSPSHKGHCFTSDSPSPKSEASELYEFEKSINPADSGLQLLQSMHSSNRICDSNSESPGMLDDILSLFENPADEALHQKCVPKRCKVTMAVNDSLSSITCSQNSDSSSGGSPHSCDDSQIKPDKVCTNSYQDFVQNGNNVSGKISVSKVEKTSQRTYKENMQKPSNEIRNLAYRSSSDTHSHPVEVGMPRYQQFEASGKSSTDNGECFADISTCITMSAKKTNVKNIISEEQDLCKPPSGIAREECLNHSGQCDFLEGTVHYDAQLRVTTPEELHLQAVRCKAQSQCSPGLDCLSPLVAAQTSVSPLVSGISSQVCAMDLCSSAALKSNAILSNTSDKILVPSSTPEVQPSVTAHAGCQSTAKLFLGMNQGDKTKLGVVPNINSPQSSGNDMKPFSKLKRKLKRFSYPSYSEILETSPKRVFNLKEDTEPVIKTRTVESKQVHMETEHECDSENHSKGNTFGNHGSCEMHYHRSKGFTTLTAYNSKMQRDESSPMQSPNAQSIKRPADASDGDKFTKRFKISDCQGQDSVYTGEPEEDVVDPSERDTTKSEMSALCMNVKETSAVVTDECIKITSESVVSRNQNVASGYHAANNGASPVYMSDSDQREAEHLLHEFGNELLVDTQFTQISVGQSSAHSDEQDIKSEFWESDLEDRELLIEDNYLTSEVTATELSGSNLCDLATKEAEPDSAECGDNDQIFEKSEEAASGEKESGSECLSGKEKKESLPNHENSLAPNLCPKYDDAECTINADVASNVNAYVEDLPFCKDDVNNSEKPPFQGFRSASGMVIQVNDAALTKYAKWLSDDGVNDDEGVTSTNSILIANRDGNTKKPLSDHYHVECLSEAHNITAKNLKASPEKVCYSEASNLNVNVEELAGSNESSGQSASTKQEIQARLDTLLSSPVGNDLTISQMYELSNSFTEFTENDTCLKHTEKKSSSTATRRPDYKKRLKYASSTVQDESSINVAFTDGSSTAIDILKQQSKVTSGFSTASGTEIHISDAAIQKAKCILDSEDVKLVYSNNEQPEKSFQNTEVVRDTKMYIDTITPDSSSLSKVCQDETVLSKREAFDLGDGQTGENNGYSGKGNGLAEKSKVINMTGFKTAGGASVSVSASAVEKASKVLQGIEKECSEEEVPVIGVKRSRRDESVTASSHVKTVNNAFDDKLNIKCLDDVKFSCDAEDRDKSVCCFSEQLSTVVCESGMPCQSVIKRNDVSTSSSEHFSRLDSQCLKNASFPDCYPLKVSMVQDCDKKTESVTVKDHPVDLKQNVNSVFPGFQTAGGSKVHVSEKSYLAAKKLLDDVTETELLSEDSKEVSFCHIPSLMDNKSSVSGYAQKDCHNVLEKLDISDQSIPHEKPLMSKALGTIHSVSYNDGTKLVLQNGSKPVLGFQTASGNKVCVSSKALAVAKKLLEDVEDNDLFPSAGSNNYNIDVSSEFPDKKASVSNSTISDSQKQFQLASDEGADRIHIDKPHTPSAGVNETKRFQSLTDSNKSLIAPFTGFQTAKGDSVNISLASLNVAKKLLADVDDGDLVHLKEGIQRKWQEKNDQPMAECHMPGELKCGMGSSRSIDKAMCETGRGPSESQLSLTQETLESTKALLLDGAFNGDICDTRQTYLKPVTKTPEEFFSDRTDQRTISSSSIVTTPSLDVHNPQNTSSSSIYRWTGPKEYKAFNAQQQIRDNQPKLITKEQTGFKKDRHLEDLKSTVFNTSYKNICNKEHKNTNVSKLNVFQPPYKLVDNAGDNTLSGDKAAKLLPVKETGNKGDSIVSSHVKECLSIDQITEEVSSSSSVEDIISDEVKKSRLHARIAQMENIQSKEQSKDTKPLPGQLFAKRQLGKQLTLKEAVQDYRPRTYSKQELFSFGIKPRTLTINASNAEDFNFLVSDYYGIDAMKYWDGVCAGDGGYLVFSDKSMIGKKEFCNALLAMPGVEPRLITKDWVYNHYKWIVWKLAAMEVGLPHHFAGRLLSPDRVLLQLKYRYDREVDHSQRSALKKIYEKDDSPHKLLVLCVCGVMYMDSQESNKAKCTVNRDTAVILTLTDSWYSIKAVLDKPLTKLVCQARIRVGDKLCIYGADFVGSHEACSPLNSTGDVMLKLNANSTRRARWYTKLGYYHKPLAPALPLCSLDPEGGMVCCIDVMVTRVYPLQFLEKMPDGSSVWRSTRGEEQTAEKFRKQHQEQLEILYQSIEEEVTKNILDNEKQNKCTNKHWTAEEVSRLEDGADIFDAITQAMDPSCIEMHLSSSQEMALASYRQERHDKLQAEIRSEIQKRISEAKVQGMSRNVIPVLKVRLAGCCSRDVDSGTTAMLTVWRPPDDICTILVEGQRVKIYNLTTGTYRASKHSGLSLSTIRNTKYEAVDVDDNLRDLIYEPREVLLSKELQSDVHPLYGEFDTVGLIVRVSDVSLIERHGGTEGYVQTVYLADSECCVVAIKLWGGLKAYYIEDIVREGVWLACTNLQWKSDGHVPWPAATATDMTHFSTKPKANHLQSALRQLQDKIKNVPSYLMEVKNKMSDVFSAKQQLSRQPLSGHHRVSLDSSLLLLTDNVKVKNLASQYVTSSSAKCHNNSKVTLHSPEVNYLEDHADVKDENLRIEREGMDSAQKNNKFRNVSTAERNPHSLDNTTGYKSLEKLQSDDPVVIKKKVLQIQKATKLELYGLAPDVTPLTSPIPSSVRQAFKPPSQTPGTPPTPRTTPSSGISTPVSNKCTPLVTKSNQLSSTGTPISDQSTPVTSRSIASINLHRSVRNKRLGASRVRIDTTVPSCNTTTDTGRVTPVTTAHVTDLTCRETVHATYDNNNQMSAVEQAANDDATDFGHNEECELRASDRETVSATDVHNPKGKRKRNTNISADATEAGEQRRKSLRLRKT